MKFRKLFVTDPDSTALGEGNRPCARFHDSFSAFLYKLDSHGCRRAVNTTRDVNGHWELATGSSVKSDPRFFKCKPGCGLAIIENGEPVFFKPFTSGTEREVAVIREKDLYPLAKSLKESLKNRRKPARRSHSGP